MPYNTRRKSLSLPSLGIHVPGSHPSRHNTATSSRSGSENVTNRINITSISSSASPSITTHPNKRQKRSHGEDTLTRIVSHKRPHYDHTPPPSPTANKPMELDDAIAEAPPRPIDLESIHDEIVEAVVVQLIATANRPHLVKELATVLLQQQQLNIVKHSANPCAIISSRLAAFMKRSCWTASAPCPLAKELETVHPRRTYYYLTTSPRQPLPEASHTFQRSIITPSISSLASGSDDGDDLDRRRSLSPEVDLSSPEFDDVDDDIDIAMPSTPVGSLPKCLRYARSHRSASPPLEKDEREFTQTADVLQKRKLAREMSAAGIYENSASAYESARDDTMFDEKHTAAMNNNGPVPIHFITSPTIKATFLSSTKKETDGDSWFKLGNLLEWDHGPENIELDELDSLMDSC
ncbi:hypothetical protein CCHL11_07065 [Colletotrichum chlorophyti]|uniref:GDS1 winged helix domain-containing protein n=1 Tax=Colletotrichum chlorophyti TaxID=708187 RepID=A0A1Q8S3H8_9PEZI|nr:hypothetical protein CCHL11_07065 [Colletotrichum chlorophyti]